MMPCALAAAIPSAWRCLIFVRSFSATKDSTCSTISERNVPIRSLPRRVSNSGIYSKPVNKSIAFTHGQKNNGYSAFTEYPLSRLPTPSDRCHSRNFWNYFLMSTRVKARDSFWCSSGDKLRLPGSDQKKSPRQKARRFLGAPAGIRTPDTLLKRQVLCLLSYWGISV